MSKMRSGMETKRKAHGRGGIVGDDFDFRDVVHGHPTTSWAFVTFDGTSFVSIVSQTWYIQESG